MPMMVCARLGRAEGEGRPELEKGDPLPARARLTEPRTEGPGVAEEGSELIR